MTLPWGAPSEVEEADGRFATPERGPQGAKTVKEDKMFAVIKTGGKQYKVASGDVLRGVLRRMPVRRFCSTKC